jgi:hypothetical protein
MTPLSLAAFFELLLFGVLTLSERGVNHDGTSNCGDGTTVVLRVEASTPIRRG